MLMAEMQKTCDRTSLVPVGNGANNYPGDSAACIWPPDALAA